MKKFVLLLLLLFVAVGEAAFQVSPIRIYLDPSSRVATIEVTNQTEKAVTFQIETMLWTQDSNGSDRYSESESLLAVPPIFMLQGNESQIIRVMSRVDRRDPKEKAFRIYINEMPDKSKKSATSLNFAFRVGIPVFVRSGAKEGTKLSIQDRALSGSSFGFWLQNHSNRFVRISKLYLTAKNGQKSTPIEPAKYLLSGSKSYFNLDIDQGFLPVVLHIVLEDGQHIELEV